MKRFHKIVNNPQATISPTILGKYVSSCEENVRSILTIGGGSQLLRRIQRHQMLGTHTAKDFRSEIRRCEGHDIHSSAIQ